MCAVIRTTTRQDVDHDHIREREDEPKEHRHNHNGGHQGHSDLEMMPPEPGTIHGSRIVNVLWNGTQTGYENDRCQGQEAPDVHGNNAPERQIGFPQPHESRRGRQEAERLQRPVQHAIERVKNPQPANAAQGNRGDPGQQQQAAHEPLAAKLVAQHLGQDIGQHEHQDLGAKSKQKGILQRLEEFGCLHDLLKMLQAHEMHRLTTHGDVAETVAQRQDKGGANEEGDIENRGGEHEASQPGLIVHNLAPPSARLPLWN